MCAVDMSRHQPGELARYIRVGLNFRRAFDLNNLFMNCLSRFLGFLLVLRIRAANFNNRFIMVLPFCIILMKVNFEKVLIKENLGKLYVVVLGFFLHVYRYILSINVFMWGSQCLVPAFFSAIFLFWG